MRLIMRRAATIFIFPAKSSSIQNNFQIAYFGLTFGTDLFSGRAGTRAACLARLDIILNINFDEIRETILFLFSLEVF